MSDYYLDNQPGAPFRAELNALLAAIRSNNADGQEPSAVAGMNWYETENDVLWRRNNSNDGWVKIYDTNNAPTKKEIGLGNVPNYGATDSLTDGSSNKFVTAAATKNLATNKLDKTAVAVDSAKLNNQPASYYATADHGHTPESIGAAPAAHKHVASDLPSSSTTAAGIVQLSSSTSGKSETVAATELAVSNAKSEAVAAGIFPGAIIMFAGSADNIPSGWQLCNGQGTTSNGIAVPDLRNRFIIGGGDAYAPGSFGGASSATTAESGAHAHSVTVGDTTLTVDQMPSHGHSFRASIKVGGDGYDGSKHGNMGNATTAASGGSKPHAHNASSASAGAHTHTVAILPPYYSLCLIIKL